MTRAQPQAGVASLVAPERPAVSVPADARPGNRRIEEDNHGGGAGGSEEVGD